MTRTFTHSRAVRSNVPVSIAIISPSGGGKTFSALRIATGIVGITGGDIHLIDTEGGRGLHYADRFNYEHIPFGAPYDPLDYLAAIEYSVKNGAKAVIVDSMSHEHDGPGGVLDQHSKEIERMTAASKNWSPETANFSAWAAPKAKRDRLMATVATLGISAIYCFRAKEKLKPAKRGDVVDGQRLERSKLVEQGLMPIGGESLIYEMTVNLFLDACSDGKPITHSEDIGTRRLIKIPGQFRDIITSDRSLSEDTGRAIALWASGKSPTRASTHQAQQPAPQKPRGDIEDMESRLQIAPDDERELLFAECKEFAWTPEERKRLAVFLPKKPQPPPPPNADDDGR